jgi:hypothetical protein
MTPGTLTHVYLTIWINAQGFHSYIFYYYWTTQISTGILFQLSMWLYQDMTSTTGHKRSKVHPYYCSRQHVRYVQISGSVRKCIILEVTVVGFEYSLSSNVFYGVVVLKHSTSRYQCKFQLTTSVRTLHWNVKTRWYLFALRNNNHNNTI